VPCVKGLSFVDDIAWWVEGKEDQALADRLSAATAASLEWANIKVIAFDHGKAEAALFHKRTAPTAKVAVGSKNTTFNKQATRWLGVRLDSQLILKEHHAIRLK
jgi:hypothetical protein